MNTHDKRIIDQSCIHLPFEGVNYRIIMKNKILLFLLFASLLCSCTNRSAADPFQSHDDLELQEMHIRDSIGRVISLKATREYLIVNERNAETQLCLFDKNSQAMYHFARTGEGPQRVLGCWNILPEENSLDIFDLRKNTLITYAVDSIKKQGELADYTILTSKVPTGSLEVGRLGENQYVAIGMFGVDRFVFFDAEGNVVKKGGVYPPKERDDVADLVHAVAYQGMMATHETKKRIAVCSRYAGVMQVFDYATEEIALTNEYIHFLANYTQTGGGANVNFSITQETRWGYLSIDANSTHIYALYSGKVQMESPEDFHLGSEIHVFDWEGNPVKKFKTDRKLSQITVDEEMLFGFDAEKEDMVFSDLPKF